MSIEKEQSALALIEEGLGCAQRPISLCSFGKDSITMLHLIRRLYAKIPVMYFRIAKFPEKQAHAQKVAQLWDMEVHDGLPSATIDLSREQFFEVLHAYSVGVNPETGQPGFIYLATGIQPRQEHDERYLCAWDDLILRPKGDMEWVWDVTFHGQKSCDDIGIADSGTIIEPIAQIGNTKVVNPLHDWSNDDVWEYIHRYEVPYDTQRYDEGDKKGSPDAYPTCYTCLESRTYQEGAWCPKVRSTIPSRAKSPAASEKDRELLAHGISKYCATEGQGRTTPNVERA